MLDPSERWYDPDSDIDNLHVMMERGAERYDLLSELEAFNQELEEICAFREEVRNFSPPDLVWTEERARPRDREEMDLMADPPVPFHAANELKRLINELVIPLLNAAGFKGRGRVLKSKRGPIATEVEFQRSSYNNFEHARFTFSVNYTISDPDSSEGLQGGFAVGGLVAPGTDYWYDVGMPAYLRRAIERPTYNHVLYENGNATRISETVAPRHERYDPNDLKQIEDVLLVDFRDILIPMLRMTASPKGLYETLETFPMYNADKMRSVLKNMLVTPKLEGTAGDINV